MNAPRNQPIRKITIHHMAGVASIEACGAMFAAASRAASSNYGIGSDGRIGMYVEEKNRAWTSSSGANDNQAVTIEVSNSATGGEWPVSDKVLAVLIDLCADISKRNGIARLNYTGDTNGNLTMHCWFAATACPGSYLKSKFPYIANEVNKRLSAAPAPTPSTPAAGNQYTVSVNLPGHVTAADAMVGKNQRVTVVPGTYYVYNRAAGAINVTKKAGTPGAWINPGRNTVQAIAAAKYVVKAGDTMSGIAAKHGVTLPALIAANPQIKNPNVIYAGNTLTIPAK